MAITRYAVENLEAVLSTEDMTEIEKERRLRNAEAAKRLLQDPMIAEFFITEEATALKAMKNLPLGAELEHYQTLHHALLASIRLRERLEAFIMEYNSFEIMEDRDSKFEGDV